MRRDDFSKLLKLVGLEYSYLSEEENRTRKENFGDIMIFWITKDLFSKAFEGL